MSFHLSLCFTFSFPHTSPPHVSHMHYFTPSKCTARAPPPFTPPQHNHIHGLVRCGGGVPCLPFTPSRRKAREAWVGWAPRFLSSSASPLTLLISPVNQSSSPAPPSVREEVKKGLDESTENQSWLGAIVQAREGEARACGVARAREAL